MLLLGCNARKSAEVVVLFAICCRTAVRNRLLIISPLDFGPALGSHQPSYPAGFCSHEWKGDEMMFRISNHFKPLMLSVLNRTESLWYSFL